MDYKYIEELLNKYFEATSTLKEEQILKTFFAQDSEELPEGLRCYKDLFAAMDGEEEKLPSGFDERIRSLTVNRPDEGGQREEALPATAVKARVISLSERFRPLLRAAAAVAIFLTMSTAINQSFKPDNVWTDEEQMAEYQRAMHDAALADTTLLYTEGVGLRSADSLAVADSLFSQPTGYIE